MLAQQVEKAPRVPWGDGGWVAEVKYDGFRLVWVMADRPRQFARSGLEHTGEYPWLDGMVLPAGTILDGEMVPEGEASSYANGSWRRDLRYVVFDVPQLGEHDLQRQPWEVRRQALEMLVSDVNQPALVQASRVLGVPDREEAERLMAEGVEGVMLKRRASTYQAGKRSWDWLKVKWTSEWDVVVVDMDGEPTSQDRKALGWKNLRYGFYVGGKLTVVSSLGVTGPPEQLAPYVGKVAVVKGWGQSPTSGAIRHPQLVKLRDDKLPEECLFIPA
jgi:bifunctional non-homologous end joining protein LigD